ncbi:SET domain-containing protein [Candidatus Parcubacteria bacterium]|nr:SET domain-containing protein [Candidatus Parcubacteria bacterium]
MNKTNEFSFILKPSQHGVGVFATHDIVKDAKLRLFGDDKSLEDGMRILPKEKFEKKFIDFCIEFEDKVFAPNDFGQMEIGWYLNHSKDFNAYHKDYNWFASRNIKEGEEILIDYNSLGEPEEVKKEYYQNMN